MNLPLEELLKRLCEEASLCWLTGSVMLVSRFRLHVDANCPAGAVCYVAKL